MYKLVLTVTLCFFVFILWVIYMANTGQSSVFFDLIKVAPYGDKAGHFILFGLLTLGANFATRLKTLKLGTINIFIGTLLVTLFVLIEELSQYYSPMRTLDIEDLLADAVGIVVFTSITYYLSEKYSNS